MATFTTNEPLSGTAQGTITKLDLSTGPHDFSFDPFQTVFYVENGEASADVVVTLSGMGVTNVECPGLGTIDASAGYVMTVSAGDTEYLNLNDRRAYFGAENNTVDVTITGATTGNSFGYIVKGV